jgi:response regulator RpfG family c-di-GMP phosphodiesterase
MKANILVVEDNRDLQRIYARILSGRYNLFQAYDTKEAWKILAKERIDLMVLDIILPKGKDGDEFYLQIVQHPEYESIPVIFATVIDDEKKAKSFANIKNAAWITKPFKEEELLGKIGGMLKEGGQDR